nr:ino eighty subunit 1 [Quercus suber]
MRAQLRTYHSIPALQAHQDPSAYKQLQDAPRLKSILKGATEDEPQPSTLEEIREATKPRTNPVNLVFVLSQYAPKVTERHFHSPRDFFDLVMRPSITSASRARAFLWLIWWYLESDFGIDGSRENPFGQGGYGAGEESGTAVPEKVPELETMTDAQTALENVDTAEEERFGEVKRKERIAILASEPSPAMTALKRARREKGAIAGLGAPDSGDEAGSDTGYWKSEHRNQITSAGRLGETVSEYTRSPSPPTSSRAVSTVNAVTPAKPASDMRIHDILNNDETEGSPTRSTTTAAAAAAAPLPIKKGPGRGNWRRNKPKQESAASTRGGDSLHNHVPLLPNNGPQSISFVNEGPVALRPNTPGSSLQQPNGGQMSPPTTISFQPPNTRDHIPTPSYQAQKRHRGVTTHQSALASHRKQQVDYTLDRRIRKLHAIARERREAEGAILRSWKRLCTIPIDYDSEEESIKIRRAKERNEKGTDDDWRAVSHHHPKGGGGGGSGKANALELLGDLESIRRPKMLYAGLARTTGEAEDIGEEPKHIARVIRRASRRLERWQESPTPGMAMIQRRQMHLQGESRAPTPAARRRKSAARRHQPHPEPGESDPMDIDEEDDAQAMDQSTQHPVYTCTLRVRLGASHICSPFPIPQSQYYLNACASLVFHHNGTFSIMTALWCQGEVCVLRWIELEWGEKVKGECGKARAKKTDASVLRELEEESPDDNGNYKRERLAVDEGERTERNATSSMNPAEAVG